ELDKIEPLKYTKQIATKNFGNISPTNINHYIANGGYEGLNTALTTLDPDKTLNQVKDSGLRGRGGAAFSTGIKWSFLAGNNSNIKYILCNCEEGDPGAFNDKGILENDPHMLLEGLILAGYATGASNGHIFIRDGHEIPIENSRKAIQQAYDLNLLGENILGTGFSYDVEVSLTGDSYVAGEETALMEAIEGKRSMPRFKPPFPAAYGLWGKPSNINNVKTLSYVPYIIKEGSDKYKSIGSESSSGTAIVCLSGHIKRPGMYEIEMGMTIKNLLNNIGGGSSTNNDIKLLQTGGPLGGVLGKEDFDVKIDFDEMSKVGAILGSGGIIVADSTTDVVDLIRTLVAFNQFESCGKCFPCRLGNTHMLDILNRICNSRPNENDMDVIKKIGNSMKTGSLCGHGQLGYSPIASAIKYFKDEFDLALSANHPVDSSDEEMILPTRTRP
ncbi:MAG: NADH-quinone oxidoreductase subunit F, partial [Chloroflexi bacterium]|nr:NADH-quinone oxidoreductase subunit F [Chloroflexota bacterium]